MRKLCSCNIKRPNFQMLSKDMFLGLQEELLASSTLKTRARDHRYQTSFRPRPQGLMLSQSHLSTFHTDLSNRIEHRIAPCSSYSIRSILRVVKYPSIHHVCVMSITTDSHQPALGFLQVLHLLDHKCTTSAKSNELMETQSGCSHQESYRERGKPFSLGSDTDRMNQ